MANQSASLSDRGRRKNNEDFAAFFEPADPGELKDSGSLYIVADGVGGAAKGERASQFAAQKVLYEYYQPENIDLEPLERLRLILERANDEIYDYASQNNTRMATTIVAAVVRAGFLYVANVGDSRAYLIRDGAAQQINRDHSIVGEMVEHGEMTEAEAMISKIKNRITRSLGGDPEVTVEVYSPIQLKTGDKILLCSDGLTRYALREDIAKMTAQGTVEETAQRLVEFANKSGGADNVSVIMTSYQETGVIEPIIRIARPKQVDLDTLVTQPGEYITTIKKKRQPIVAITWLVLFVGVIGVALLLGGMIGSIIFPTPTVTASPTSTFTPAPADTPTIIQTSTNIPPTVAKTDITPNTIPSKTPQTGTDKSKMVTETCPDGSKVAPDTKFTKTWDIKNVGSNTWNTSYTLVFFSSDPANVTMGSLPRIPFPQDVLPETGVTLSVPLTAPSDPGFYKVSWKLENDRNEPIAIGTGWILYIYIQVDETGNTTCP